ncbi:hypothetical protein QE152_g40033, partial [Popillia japonica]
KIAEKGSPALASHGKSTSEKGSPVDDKRRSSIQPNPTERRESRSRLSSVSDIATADRLSSVSDIATAELPTETPPVTTKKAKSVKRTGKKKHKKKKLLKCRL